MCSPGTAIATPKGEIAVDALKVGDPVFTRDAGVQTIVWIGIQTVTGDALAHSPAFQPVLVQAGALGPKLPERDLLISQNHRILMSGPQAVLHFDETEVLAAAKHLTGLAGIDVVQTLQPVTFIHMMFARDEIILANGCWVESVQTDDLSVKGIANRQANEIITLFPALADNHAVRSHGAPRKVLKRHEAGLRRR